jgi:hypothetical protein
MEPMMNSSLLLAACLLVQAAPAENDLTGKVSDAEGKPIARATAFVYTAKPRAGASVFCPSCYADCRKKAATDEAGKFTISALDPELLFRILVVAEGYRPQFAKDADPQNGPLEVKLDKMPEKLAGRAVLRGRVVDPHGTPVVGAVVSPFGCKRIDKRWWGSTPGVDAAGVTNERGEFLITGNEGDLAYDLEIESRNFAKRLIELVPTGETVQEITLTEGATVTGRILLDGKPAAGVVVGLSQSDRSAGKFVGAYTIATNGEGCFAFANVHPNDRYYRYTLMSGTQGRGGVRVEVLDVGGDGTVKNAGDLSLKPAHQVAGQILVTDGMPVPPSTQIYLGREGVWDSQVGKLTADGGFHFDNVPTEPVTISLRIPGYRLANKLNRFQQLREGSIALFVDQDKPKLQIHFEPENSPTP